MYCFQCGKHNDDSSNYCISCASSLRDAYVTNQPSQVPAKTIRKKNAAAIVFGALSLVLAVVLGLTWFGVLSVNTSSSVQSMAFSAPEDAITYFIDCVKKEDLSGALKACAIDEIANGFNYFALSKRVNALVPLKNAYMPSKYSMYVEFNRNKAIHDITSKAVAFTVSFNLSEQYRGILEGSTVFVDDNEEFIESVITEMRPDINRVQIIRIDKNIVHDYDRSKEIRADHAAYYGADELEYRTVLYQYDGDYYIGGFGLLRYNDKWLIFEMSDPYSGISYMGDVQKINDLSQYDKLIEG